MMTPQKRLVKGIHEQRELLENLIERLDRKEELNCEDYFLYELTTKEVETNLRKLRQVMVKKYSKHLKPKTIQACTNKE